MFSMFAHVNTSSKSEMGRFLARAPVGLKDTWRCMLTAMVDRLKEQYGHWGSADEESVGALQGFLDNCQPLLLTKAISTQELSENVIFETELRSFLFGDIHRQEALTNMFAQIQAQGKVVTILTKGIGVCVLGALLSLMPQWLGDQAPSCAATRESGVQEVPGIHCIAIVDYAGLRWHAGNISRAAPPCMPKLAQISFYCAEFASSQMDVRRAMLIDDSACHEIEGMDSKLVGATPSWKLRHVMFDPRKVHLPNHARSLVQEHGVILDCIVGGPRRNGQGLLAEDCAEIVRVSSI